MLSHAEALEAKRDRLLVATKQSVRQQLRGSTRDVGGVPRRQRIDVLAAAHVELLREWIAHAEFDHVAVEANARPRLVELEATQIGRRHTLGRFDSADIENARERDVLQPSRHGHLHAPFSALAGEHHRMPVVRSSSIRRTSASAAGKSA